MNRGPMPILRVFGKLLVSIQTELSDDVAEAFQEDLLGAIEDRPCDGVVIDITGLEIVDTYVARVLANTARMARLMGTDTVLVGMRPEVAATLVQMGYPLDGIHTKLDVDAGLLYLDALKKERER